MLSYAPVARQPVDPIVSIPKTVRIAVIGDSGVGKTCLLEKYLSLDSHFSGRNDRYSSLSSSSTFSSSSSSANTAATPRASGVLYSSKNSSQPPGPTLGVDYMKKKVLIKGEEISLHFWNISGKAVFTDIAREFFKESDAVVLVFDVTSRSSFESLPRWLDLLQPYLDDRRFSLFLCGNKSESCKRVIEEEEGKHWAFSNGFPYYEVSANTGRNLESLFYNILVSLPLITSKI